MFGLTRTTTTLTQSIVVEYWYVKQNMRNNSMLIHVINQKYMKIATGNVLFVTYGFVFVILRQICQLTAPRTIV